MRLYNTNTDQSEFMFELMMVLQTVALVYIT